MFRVFLFAEIIGVLVWGYSVNRDVCVNNKNEKEFSNDALLGHCYQFENPNSPLMQIHNRNADDEIEATDLDDPSLLDKYFYKWGGEEEESVRHIPGLEEESAALPSLPIFNILKDDEVPLLVADEDHLDIAAAWNLDEVSKLTDQHNVPPVLKSIDERRILDDQVPPISDQMEVESELMQETNDMLHSELGETFLHDQLEDLNFTEIPVILTQNNSIIKDQSSTIENHTDSLINNNTNSFTTEENYITTTVTESSTEPTQVTMEPPATINSSTPPETEKTDFEDEIQDISTTPIAPVTEKSIEKVEKETSRTEKSLVDETMNKNVTLEKRIGKDSSSLIGIINAL